MCHYQHFLLHEVYVQQVGSSKTFLSPCLYFKDKESNQFCDSTTLAKTTGNFIYFSKKSSESYAQEDK